MTAKHSSDWPYFVIGFGQWGCLMDMNLISRFRASLPAILHFLFSRQNLGTLIGWRLRRFGGTIIWWRVYHYWKWRSAEWLSSHSSISQLLVLIWPTPQVSWENRLSGSSLQRYISTLQPIQRWHLNSCSVTFFENVNLYPNTSPLWSRNWSTDRCLPWILTTWLTSWVLFMVMFHALRNHLTLTIPVAGTGLWKCSMVSSQQKDQKKWWLLWRFIWRESSQQKLR